MTRLTTRPRLFGSLLLGAIAAFALPGVEELTTRALAGWNIAVYLYLAAIGVMVIWADQAHARRTASEQAENALQVLAIFVTAAVVSLVAVVLELRAAKTGGGAGHLALAIATVIGSWVLVPTLFATTYSSLYHHQGGQHHRGLKFPSESDSFSPEYSDFFYFSFTIAVAAQTADVAVTSRAMRRLVLMQALVSFLFNTTILAFTVNLAATLLQ